MSPPATFRLLGSLSWPSRRGNSNSQVPWERNSLAGLGIRDYMLTHIHTHECVNSHFYISVLIVPE